MATLWWTLAGFGVTCVLIGIFFAGAVAIDHFHIKDILGFVLIALFTLAASFIAGSLMQDIFTKKAGK